MRSYRCSFSALANRISETSAGLPRPRGLRRRLRRPVVCCVLILSLLFLPGSGTAYAQLPELAAGLAKFSTLPIAPLSALLKRLFGKSTQRQQDTTSSRSNRVVNITINPAKIVGYQGQSVNFSAVGRNGSGETVQGARFNWSASDSALLEIDDSGQATLLSPGLAWVTASTESASHRAPVLIRPGERTLQTDADWQADQDRLRPDGSIVGATGGVGTLIGSMIDKLTPTAYAQSGGGDSNDFLYDELWSEPRNLVGVPLNRVMDSSMIGAVLPEGSNFEFSVPIYGLAGRGLSSGLALNYNSRVWSRHGSAVTFNATNTWPYVGFSISFGRIVTYGSSSALKYVLIDPAGTRRFLGTGGTAGQTVTLRTNDGSHITYVGNASGGGSLYVNNGTKMTVGLVNNRLLVTRIRDANGNYIDISYATQSPPNCNSGLGFQWKQAINTITDTLGRVVTFNYDICNNLVSITAPDYEAGTQILAQFDYQAATISNSFSGLTVENRPTGFVAQLKHVYFPATQTGYKFSYSVYGMIYTVSMRKQMSIDGNGVISDGTEKAYVNFNYPTSASSLTDAPSFTQRTEFPAATSGGTAVYSYSSGSGTGTKNFTIMRPDSSTVTLTRSDTAGVAFGLLTQSEIKNSGGTSMAKSVITYANDPGGSPQVQTVISYDDATPNANQTKVDFDYDAYGNVTNTREYGFQDAGAWKVRRRSRSVYKTDTAYVDAYLRSLVIESDVYDAQLDTSDANDVLIAKTTYTIDDYTGGLGGLENYSGPPTPPPGHLTSYGATYTLRGNVTGRTNYLDVTAPTTVTWLMKLDIFGNVIKSQLACCNEQTTSFTDQNGFALPESVTKGPSGGAQVTTSASFDFNTSLTMDTTDPNGEQTTINTRDEVLRPTLTTYPTGATATAS